MKPILEEISLSESKKSLTVFEREEIRFSPFWHYHPEIELTLILRGNGLRFVGDHVEHYHAGDLVLLGSNLPHHWISQDESSNQYQKAVVIQFSAKMFEFIPDLSPIREFLDHARVGFSFLGHDKGLNHNIQTMVGLPAPLQIGRLVEILYHLSKHPEKQHLSKTTKFNVQKAKDQQKRINELISYIVANPTDSLTVQKMAETCNMVPQSFCRWFKRNTGLSFITFVNKTRIQMACQYLMGSDLDVQSIAYLVGFENISHFNRTFKKITGLSPTAFKKQNHTFPTLA